MTGLHNYMLGVQHINVGGRVTYLTKHGFSSSSWQPLSLAEMSSVILSLSWGCAGVLYHRIECKPSMKSKGNSLGRKTSCSCSASLLLPSKDTWLIFPSSRLYSMRAILFSRDYGCCFFKALFIVQLDGSWIISASWYWPDIMILSMSLDIYISNIQPKI